VDHTSLRELIERMPTDVLLRLTAADFDRLASVAPEDKEETLRAALVCIVRSLSRED
jgi:hypothetical protein